MHITKSEKKKQIKLDKKNSDNFFSFFNFKKINNYYDFCF